MVTVFSYLDNNVMIDMAIVGSSSKYKQRYTRLRLRLLHWISNKYYVIQSLSKNLNENNVHLLDNISYCEGISSSILVIVKTSLLRILD